MKKFFFYILKSIKIKLSLFIEKLNYEFNQNIFWCNYFTTLKNRRMVIKRVSSYKRKQKTCWKGTNVKCTKTTSPVLVA